MDLPREWESETNSASSDEHLPNTSKKMKFSTKNLPIKKIKLAIFRRWTKVLREATNEGPTVLHTRSVAYLTHPSNIKSTSPGIARAFYTKPCGRFIEIKSNFRRKKRHGTNQSFNFLGGRSSNGDNRRTLIQFRRER